MGRKRQSSGSQQPEPKRKDLIKTKSVRQGKKILKDRIDRRIKKDNMADMVSFACLMICAMANKIFFPYPLLVAFHKQIKRKWPVRSDVQSIRGKIGAIKDADRMEETQNMRKLIKIEEDLGKLNEQRLGVNQNKRQCSKGFDLMERIKEIQDAAPMEVPDKMQTFIDIGEKSRRLDEPGLEVYRIKRQFPERLVLENLEEDMEEMQDTTEARREETEEKEKRFEDVRKEMQRLRRQLEEMEKKLEDTRKENQRLLHRPLEEMKKKLEDMRKENQRLKEELGHRSEEMEKTLQDLRKENQMLKAERRKGFHDSTEVNRLIETLIPEVGNVETSRAKPSSAFQDNATNGPTADQAQGSLQTCEELQYSFKDFDEFKNKVFAKDNNKVNVLQFPNLEEAIKIASTIVPDYLQHIAGKIQIDRGTCTEFELINIQLLVCAAIKEMEDLPLQQLNLSTFLKWGATFNRAKELGFQVKFADTLLKNNLGIFFGYQRPS